MPPPGCPKFLATVPVRPPVFGATLTSRTCVTDAFVDKGYRGHNYEGDATVHISGSSKRKLTRTQKNRRSAVEPKIGHLKSDNRMGRCILSVLAGDEINAVLVAAGFNLRKLLSALVPGLNLLGVAVLKRLRPVVSQILSPAVAIQRAAT